MKSYWAAVAVMALTALYVTLAPPRNLALGQGRLQDCPRRFGEWNGEELSFADAVVDELRADDLLVRRYVRGSDVVWLCIIYHQNARYGAHDPQVCYDSQGYLVTPGRPARVENPQGGQLDVNTFLAERPHDRRLVYYWWYTQDVATGDRDAFQRRMAFRGALDNRSWGAFVRVESLALPGQDARAAENCRGFAREVLRVLPSLFAGAETPGTRAAKEPS